MSVSDKKNVRFSAPTPTYYDLLDEWRSRARPIVIWAGAGLSAPAGLPSWPTLQKKVVAEAKEYVASLSEEQQREKQAQYKALQSIDNPWLIFEKLESILGSNAFEASIKRHLNHALKCEVPKIYIELWKLGVNGFLTLNVDRLASRGYGESAAREALIERSGFDVKALIGSINTVNSARFIANLHGVFEDPTTWVFTEPRRKALFADPRYQEFVRDILKYCTVVMLGVSAHDIAIRDHMARLKADGLGSHAFWLSSEVGSEALQLAESSGVRFISYKNTDGAHGELLNFLEDIKSFSTPIFEAPPVISQVSSDGIPEDLAPIEKLLTLSPNEQRALLNAQASRILTSDTEHSYERFEQFCKEYNRVIHAAGLFDTEDGSDKVLNYTLSALEDSEGGFGTIWRAYADDGSQVAIKVFKHDIRKNQNLLKAFRRGVRSLKILAKHNLPNIIQFKTACEIPPILVMEWIEGVNMFTAVTQGKFKNWESRLRVACDLSEAIYRAHSVPERVLHRDIKPQNIMFKDFYQEQENSELVVLDFDLSWHVGALEKSVLAKGANPYLAPEQLTSISEMTSRSAAVDAYGLGMTLYFLCTGLVPTPFMHQSNDWKARLEQIANQNCKPWRSAPRRIARLIELCTKHDQNLRPSFSQITADLDKLNSLIQGDLSHLDIRFICEELAARVEALQSYTVEADGVIVWSSPTKRLKTTIRPVNIESLSIKFEFIQTGNEQFNSLANASDLISKSHSHFPPALMLKPPTYTQQHGHYMNEVHVNLEMPVNAALLGILQKSLDTVMDRLMTVSS